jgi:hypothetical protein
MGLHYRVDLEKDDRQPLRALAASRSETARGRPVRRTRVDAIAIVCIDTLSGTQPSGDAVAGKRLRAARLAIRPETASVSQFHPNELIAFRIEVSASRLVRKGGTCSAESS